MKNIYLLIILLIATPAVADPKFAHMEAKSNGWQFLYYEKNEPIIVFVPKCTDKLIDNCGWNHTSAKDQANKLVKKDKEDE